MLKIFSKYNLQPIEICLSQTSFSGFNQFGGNTMKATLYHGEGLLFFAPKKQWFNRLHNRLPLLLTATHVKGLPEGFHYKHADDIHFGESITITFEETTFVKRRTEVTISSNTESSKLKEVITRFKHSN